MKNYILVAGVDYHPIADKKEPTDFKKYCTSYIDKLKTALKFSEDICFYIVDIYRGIISKKTYTYNSDIKKLNSPIEATHSKFDNVSYLNYFDLKGNGKKYFHPNKKKIISKYDIYNLINEIGINEPNTLAEVSIFSHAQFSGPILVNSLNHTSTYTDYFGKEIKIETENTVDPNDFDFRVWDITSYLPKSLIADTIKTAFITDESVFRIWGCNNFAQNREFLSKVLNHKNYKASGLEDDVNFNITTWNENSIEWLNNFFGKGFKKGVEFNLTFLEIKKFFCYLIQISYSYDAAKFFNVKFHFAVPTSYADISPFFIISSKTYWVIPFFKEYLNVDFQSALVYKNYALINPDFTCM